MKRVLLTFALLSTMIGVNAQVGVKTVTVPGVGTETKISTDFVQQSNSRAATSNAEILWHKAEEYGIGGNAYVSDETGTGIVNWETNDARTEAYLISGMTEWDFTTTTEWPFISANNSCNLTAIADGSTLTLIDGDGNVISTINPGGVLCATVNNEEGTAVYVAYENANGNVARYTKDGTLEWVTELSTGLVGINVSGDESKLIVTCAGNNTMYVIDPETGDILQDDVYYYQNSPKQAPALSYDGTYVTWGDFNGKGYLKKWNGERYEDVWSASIKSNGQSSCWGYGCAISKDGSTIALGTLGFVSSGYDGYVFLFNNYSSTPIWSAQTGGPVNWIDITADGSLIAVASDGPTDHSTGDLLIYRRHSNEVFLEVNTAGSMNAVNITDDGAYCIGSGKAVHSYEMGWGGNAYLINSIPTTAGSLSGIVTLSEVTDFSDAMITIDGLDTYYEYTNADGEFTIKYIPEGTYDITISKIGFTSQTISDIEIAAGETTNIEVTLEPVGSPIKNLYASKGTSNVVELRWDATNEEAEEYNIYRKDNINATFTEVFASVSTENTTFTDETAIPTINYYYAVTAILPGEVETPLSNIDEGFVSTTFLTETIEVFNGSAPTIDGVLSEDEWNDAFKVDISDFTGISEGIDPVGTVYLYLKTDGDKLYMALEDFKDNELSENDCLALYFDDNNDHVYPTGNDTEGNYWFKYSGGTGILQYRPIYGTGGVGDVFTIEDAEVAFSDAAGHVTGEFVLEFGEEDHQISVSSDNESSVYMFYRSSGSEYHAYWPYNNIDTFSPVGYDTFKYFTEDETPEAPENLHVDEDILGTRDYVPVRWDMPEMNDFSHFNVFINSNEVSYTVYGAEVVMDVESNTDYSVYVTTVDNNGNESDASETLTFHVGVIGLDENTVSNVRLYPNPATSVVNIETDMQGSATANIIDLSGRLVKRININEIQNASINIEDLQGGMYFFMIQQNDIIIVRKVNVR